ncbi:Putative emopamil-binding protein [Septoria linicola]|uniref:Emopamil-binding protein n=1 Tax=Septoria linicola TaxID=215465 RepID=A0A9Q9AHT9_9PEZI|nr:Putative emopamil-binding protein [Septoria linicola]
MAATILHQNVADSASSIEDVAEEAANPYYPIGSTITNWTPNELSVLALLGAFTSASVVLFTATFVLVRRLQPSLTRAELLAIMWFVLSGTIHIVFEGYYVRNYATLGSHQTLLGQMWKEYALSDSRYLTQNGLVLCLETATVFVWGPICLLVAALVVFRSPWRFSLQIIVSMAHIYGDVVYYATSIFDHAVHGISYSRPEPFYFWFYFVFMNSLWIVIPGVLIYQACSEAASAIAITSAVGESKKAD